MMCPLLQKGRREHKFLKIQKGGKPKQNLRWGKQKGGKDFQKERMNVEFRN